MMMNKLIGFAFWLLFCLKNTVMATFTDFTSSSTCTASPSNCSLSCSGSPVDITDIIVSSTSNYYERVFNYSSTDYKYFFIIPECGNEPSFPSPYEQIEYPTPSWSASAIWQFSNTDGYYLGSYDSSSWKFGDVNGQDALSVTFLNGEDCSGFGTLRKTTMFLVCDGGYSVNAPFISLTETSTCVYEIYIGLKAAFCDFSTVSPSIAPTVVPSIHPTRGPSLRPTVVPSMTPTANPNAFFESVLTCTAPPSSAPTDCSLSCSGSSLDLTDMIVNSTVSYYNRVFSTSATDFQYYFIIPVCGREPPFPSPYTSTVTPTPTWDRSSIWQFYNSDSFYLGLYDSSSWEYGNYNGAGAVSVTFSDGQPCNDDSTPRRTTMYLVCAEGWTEDSPQISVNEISTCVYTIYVGFEDMCLVPLATPVPSSAPSIAPSVRPSILPSVNPTVCPSLGPSLGPSVAPSVVSIVSAAPSVQTTTVLVNDGGMIPTDSYLVDGLILDSLDEISNIRGSIAVRSDRRKLMSLLGTSILCSSSPCLSTSDTSSTVQKSYLFYCVSANTTIVVSASFSVSSRSLSIETTHVHSKLGGHYSLSCSAVNSVHLGGESLTLATCDTCEGYFLTDLSFSTTAVYSTSTPSSNPVASAAVTTDSSSSSSLTMGAFIGIVIAAVFVLIVFVVGVYHFVSRNRKTAPAVSAGHAELVPATSGDFLAPVKLSKVQPVAATFEKGPVKVPPPAVLPNAKIDFLLSFGNDGVADNLDRIKLVNDYLLRTGRTTWFDENHPADYDEVRQARAIAQADHYVIFISKGFIKRIRENTRADDLFSCGREFDMAVTRFGPDGFRVIVLEQEMLNNKLWDPVDGALGDILYYNGTTNEKLVAEALDALDKVVPVPPDFKHVSEDIKFEIRCGVF